MVCDAAMRPTSSFLVSPWSMSCLQPDVFGLPSRKFSPPTGFYISCELFGSGQESSASAAEDFAKEEEVEERLASFTQLSHPQDQILADELQEVKQLPNLTAAARHCAEDGRCSAVCRSAESGWANFYHGPLKRGFEEDSTGQGRWTCLAIHGFEPPQAALGPAMRRCPRPMALSSEGVWTPQQILRDVVYADSGDRVSMLLNAEAKEEGDASTTSSFRSSARSANAAAAAQNLEDAKSKCIADQRCEAFCFHEASGRLLIYGNVDKAHHLLGAGHEGWRRLLEPSASAAWLGQADGPAETPSLNDGWICQHIPPKCRHEAAKLAHAQGMEARQQRAAAKRDVQLLHAALARQPSSVEQGFGTTLTGAEFWGRAGCPLGEQLQDWGATCSRVRGLLARAEVGTQLPWSCRSPTLIRRGKGKWLKCCEVSDTQVTGAGQQPARLVCKELLESPSDQRWFCSGPDRVCLAGSCEYRGWPGELHTKSGTVVEVLSMPRSELAALLLARPGLHAPGPRPSDHLVCNAGEVRRRHPYGRRHGQWFL